MDAKAEARFAEIYRDHAGLVGRTARAFAPEPADRDELFQEILVALWQALPQFTAQAKLSTYVYRVSLNCALNWQRSRRRYRARLDGYQTLHAASPDTTSPAEQARLSWLYACIHALPPVDRSLILLFLDQIPYTEIAEITGLSESNVGVRLHRIKQHLIAQSRTVSHEL